MTRLPALFLIVCFTLPLHSQDVAPPVAPPRPKLGLALSGGSALGLAHIGVLRYFEEHRIPVDVVAGTSMGGLVGGLYATGLDSAQLADIAEHADWDLLLDPTPQFRDRPAVEKHSWNRSYSDLTLRLGHRFTLPQGINSGEALALFLSRHTAAYGDIAHFDDLPTPFRCVATDLIRADRVVLERGSLAKAMRATMSLPAIFTPVRWDDLVLVDGGLVQNLPVEVLQTMGATRTIAVTLHRPAPDPKRLTSLADIALRSITVAIEQNERRSVGLADVVIKVDAGQFSSVDFARAHDLIELGYKAAAAQAEKLREFQISDAEWAAFLDQRKRRIVHAPEHAPVAVVRAADPRFREDATDELRRKLGRDEVSLVQLEQTLSGIVSATGVPGASYQWDRIQKGYRVEFLERNGESIYVRPSFTLGISPGEPSRTALHVSLTRIGADVYKTRALFAATLGQDPGLRAEYYQPVGGTGYFFAPGFFVQRSTMYEYSPGARVSHTRDRVGGSFHAGIGTWRFVQARLGITAGYDWLGRRIAVDGVKPRNTAFVNPELTWLYNTQDAAGLPYRGTRIEGSVGYAFREHSYPFVRTDASYYRRLNGNLTWVSTAQLGTSFGAKLDYYEQFRVGGAGQLSAFRYHEFSANTLLLGGGGVIFHTPAYRKLSLYPQLLLMYEAGRFDRGSAGWETHQSTSAGVFFPTRLGPVGLALSFNQRGKARVRLSVGSLGKR